MQYFKSVCHQLQHELLSTAASTQRHSTMQADHFQKKTATLLVNVE